MKLTLRLIENLRNLLSGESIPHSALPKSLVDPLVEEGILSVTYHKTRRCLTAPNPAALAGALPQYNEALRDLDAAERLLTDDNSRAAQAAVSGNSKTRARRTTPGFLVNSYRPVDCMLSGHHLVIEPAEGSAVYIADWQSFVPAPSILIIGIENTENFLGIRAQKALFDHCMRQEESGILFISRYAFSSDLMNWLARIPNRYVHFGDFDLAGIDIFLKQFKPHVGGRGSFLIPPDIESRLRQGSRKRYDDQFQKYSGISTSDPTLSHLISLIHKYRRCYDQEGYIVRN